MIWFISYLIGVAVSIAVLSYLDERYAETGGPKYGSIGPEIVLLSLAWPVTAAVAVAFGSGWIIGWPFRKLGAAHREKESQR